MKLFAVYIGGEYKGAHIEMHDMRFVVAHSIEDTYPQLRRQWWGIPRTLHVDCWSELVRADGYGISLRQEPFAGREKLFYVHLGGYDPGQFTEMHRNLFVVAQNEAEAKQRALDSVQEWKASHKDKLLEAEQAFCIGAATQDSAWHIHLEKIGDGSPSPFTCKYIPIGRGA